MPELPEVETVVRDLRSAGLEGRTITDARVYWPRTVDGLSARAFRARLKGQRVNDIARHGKYIIMRLSDDCVLVHLRMTGKLCFAEDGARRGKHEHVVLRLDDGRTLRFHDTRKFGRWWVMADPAEKLAALGPDGLDPRLTRQVFVKRLARHSGMLKPLLLNQAVVAGLGNIYVDEALFEAGLHPRRRCATLSADELGRLYRAVRTVLRRGVRSMGTTLGSGDGNFYSVAGRRGRNQDRLKVFRRQGLPCPRCGTTVQRTTVAQRGTHFCPGCQKG